jgi:hypothetical protein
MINIDKQQLVNLVNKHKFSSLIIGVVLLSVFITLFNMTLYIKSGASSLDLSRPDYEQLRTQTKDSVSDSEAKFSPTGKLTTLELDQFKKIYNDKRQEESKLGDFQDESLNDASLRLDIQTFSDISQ